MRELGLSSQKDNKKITVNICLLFQLEQRGQGVDSYLSAAEQMQKSDSEFQLDLYTKMGVRNNQIEESANNDEEATQEFMKVN